MSVSVARGAVAVARDDTGSGREVIRQGEEIVYGPSAAVPVKHAVEPDNVGAWRHGRLVFDHEPLERVVARVNRYITDGQIRVTDTTLSSRPFTGVLRVGDARRTAIRLAGLMQLTYKDDGNFITLYSRQAAPPQP